MLLEKNPNDSPFIFDGLGVDERGINATIDTDVKAAAGGTAIFAPSLNHGTLGSDQQDQGTLPPASHPTHPLIEQEQHAEHAFASKLSWGRSMTESI
jgi:hypothetical protein